MATLNVKNLPDPLYRKLKARAKRERRSVAQEVTILLTQALEPSAARSDMPRGISKGRQLTQLRHWPANLL